MELPRAGDDRDRWAEVERLAHRARQLVGAGEPDAVADVLERLVRSAGLDEVQVSSDDAGRLTLALPFDPVTVERLGRLSGARRDAAAGLWRVARSGHPGLVDLLARLGGPACSAAGCALGEEAPASVAQRDAHAAWCE